MWVWFALGMLATVILHAFWQLGTALAFRGIRHRQEQEMKRKAKKWVQKLKDETIQKLNDHANDEDNE